MPTQSTAISDLYVVSDLHLGGTDPDYRLCNQSKLLADLIWHIAGRCQAVQKQGTDRVVLLLAGDIIDFLIRHEDVPGYQPPLRSESEAVAILEKVQRDNPELFTAMKDLLKEPAAELVVMLGNHDLELRYRAVWQLLERSILDSKSRGKLHPLCNGDRGYDCVIGGAEVLCVHGNEFDPWNPIDYARLASYASQEASDRPMEPPKWEANHGTRLVIHQMNAAKYDLRYPFVDLLKPEQELVPALLLLLEPKFTRKEIPDLLAAKAAVKAKELISRTTLRGEVLGERDTDVDEVPMIPAASFLAPRTERVAWQPKASKQSSATLLEQTQRDHDAGLLPSDLVTESEDELGLPRYLADRVLGLRTKQEAIRHALMDWISDDHSFAVSERDDQYRKLFKALQKRSLRVRWDFVISGHSHLCRAIENDDGTFYFNTGTWMQLIRLSAAQLAQPDRFMKLYESLFGDHSTRKSLSDLAAAGLTWNRPTVVRIQKTERGAEGELLLVKQGMKGKAPSRSVDLVSLQEWPFAVENGEQRT